jgi:site-specific DNA-cytosine methylase
MAKDAFESEPNYVRASRETLGTMNASCLVVVATPEEEEEGLPLFEPKSTDVFIKPELYSLVSYLWTDDENGKDYRTGLLVVDKKDTLRFYDGVDGNGDPLTQQHCFVMTKKEFKEGKFRVRADLKPGSRCYDSLNKKWCDLVNIDISSGGVTVLYDNSSDAVLIPADDLAASGNEVHPVTPDAKTINEENELNRASELSRATAEVTSHMVATPVKKDGLPTFEPKPTDVFVKPELYSLVSYVWTDDENGKDYRTGVLIDKKDTLRFYDGLDGNGDPLTQQHCFAMTKKEFIKGNFRVRSDLRPGRRCYDSLNDKWCDLVDVNISSGGVRALYENSTDAVLIPADDLVGSRNNTRRPLTPDVSAMKGEKRKRLETKGPNEWIGVHRGVDTIGAYYIRGKLRESDDEVPWLVAGERVRYSSLPGETNTQMLELDDRSQEHLEIVPKGKLRQLYDRYKAYARKAEENYADKIRKERLEERRDRGLHRSTSLALRPLQPVHVLGKSREAIVVEPQDPHGWIKIMYDESTKETIQFSKVRLLGHVPEPIILDDFFRENPLAEIRQSDTYHKASDFLLKAWRQTNGEEKSKEFEKNFKRVVEARGHVRQLMGAAGNGSALPSDVMWRLEYRTTTLRTRLEEDFQLPRERSGMDSSMFKSRITEVKNMNPHPNLLLLCGGFAPEVIAHKRLPGAATLGTVIIQDTDLVAVGVAVAANPDVDFSIAIDDPNTAKYEPGDVRILSSRKLELVREIEVKVGGIHDVHITNPCQSFSLAGSKQGLRTENGQLLLHCVNIVNSISKTSDMPMYLAENVKSTDETNEHFNTSLPDCDAAYFYACASMCSPSKRNRKFATNRPPVECAEGPGPRRVGEPPSLNGDLPEVSAQTVVEQNGKRMVHPKLKKFPCLTHSGPKSELIWQFRGDYEEPTRTSMTPEESERAMGYFEHEIGVTKYTAHKAILKRIQEHNYENDGCLVSLKGCADEKDLLETVDAKKRLQLLGNSQVVTLLEALLWDDIRLFPGTS